MLQKLSLSLLTGLLLASASVEARQDPLALAYEEAYIAWDEGRYITALEGFARLLDSPGGEAYLERIAEVTGEVYHTVEIASDGRAVRFGPDGRYAAYETGTGAARVTHVLSLENGVRKIAEIEGAAGLVFSPDGERVAYLAHSETRAVRNARAELEKAASAGDRAELFRRRAALAYEEARAARVAIRDLRTAREERFRTGDLLIAELTFSIDGETLYAVAGRDGDAARTDIYAIAGRGEPVALTDGPGYKQALAVVPGGTHLVYTVDTRSPVPQAPGTQLAQQASGDARRVVIHELATGAERVIEGHAPSLSADGSTVVFLTAEDGVNVIRTARVQGDASPATALRTTDRIAAPALSPDGSTVVYQRMLREDWELFLVDAEGGNDWRLTWEIQHDHTARFIGPHTVLAVMGEGRHRRSYLYDTRTMERTRLHHNNTVRTIAPEYEWAVDPAGERVLIVSDRDGDTVSPERGVYLMDLTRRVTPAELRERIRMNLAAERDLRERGEKSFAPIEAEVRRIVDRVSKTKLYEYQDDLHRFGSKHITQPGNLKAAEYLFKTLESWGYEPEYQWFEPRPGIRTPNVVATLRGTVDPDLVYVVGSHFDSVERGPGADDNTSGTAVLLETARVLADSPLPATVQFVFFTGEESGLLGAREYVRRALEEGLKVRGALNNDMVGFANDHRLDNTIRYSNAGIRDVQHAAAFLFSRLITYDSRYYQNTDAHALFDGFGDVLGGIGSYPVLGSPHYHQSHDVLEIIDHELLYETTRANIASIMRLAHGPSRVEDVRISRPRRGHAELRWTPAPESDVTGYIVTWGPEEDPHRHTLTITEPRATLENFGDGYVFGVEAVNSRGLVSWGN